MLQVTYIYHSGFLVELEQSAFLFDYWKGEIPPVSKDKELYVLVSHKHRDHFNMKIFELALVYPKIHFILSKEVKMNEKYMDRKGIPVQARDKILYVTGSREYLAGDCRVETLISTDSGVAFIVESEEKTIYHAGDLNWWIWKEETEAENKSMQEAYIREIDKLKGRKIDVAFLPLDPRQEEFFYYGFDYFMRQTDTQSAYPMHCWGDKTVVARLLALPQSLAYRDKIIKIKDNA